MTSFIQGADLITIPKPISGRPASMSRGRRSRLRTALRSTSLAGLAAAMAGLGCVSGPPRPRPVPAASTASELLSIVSAGYGGLKDLEIRADISLRVDGVRQKASAVILFRAPGELKFDVAGPMGIGILSGLVRGDTLQLYLPRANKLLVGPPGETLYRVTGVNLSYYELRRAILGLPNLSPLALPRVGRFATSADTYQLEIDEPLWTRKLTLDRQSAFLMEERVVDPHGFELSRRSMDDYRDANGVILPRRIRILQGADRIDIRTTRRRVNTGLIDRGGRFILRIPSDVTRVEVETP